MPEDEKKKEKKGEEVEEEVEEVKTPELPPGTQRVFINNVDEWVGRTIAGELYSLVALCFTKCCWFN
jgi:hypothetical protein